MNLEKFTERSRGFLQAAQTIAMRESHQRLAPEHFVGIAAAEELDIGVAFNQGVRHVVGIDHRQGINAGVAQEKTENLATERGRGDRRQRLVQLPDGRCLVHSLDVWEAASGDGRGYRSGLHRGQDGLSGCGTNVRFSSRHDSSSGFEPTASQFDVAS